MISHKTSLYLEENVCHSGKDVVLIYPLLSLNSNIPSRCSVPHPHRQVVPQTWIRFYQTAQPLPNPRQKSWNLLRFLSVAPDNCQDSPQKSPSTCLVAPLSWGQQNIPWFALLGPFSISCVTMGRKFPLVCLRLYPFSVLVKDNNWKLGLRKISFLFFDFLQTLVQTISGFWW